MELPRKNSEHQQATPQDGEVAKADFMHHEIYSTIRRLDQGLENAHEESAQLLDSILDVQGDVGWYIPPSFLSNQVLLQASPETKQKLAKVLEQQGRFDVDYDHSMVADVLLEFGGDVAKEEVRTQLKQLIETNPTSLTARNYAEGNGAPNVINAFHEELDSIITNQFGVRANNLVPHWNMPSGDLAHNLAAMTALEQARRGSTKDLYEKYNIKNFRRYPKELLLSQLAEENTPQPYGVILYAEHDHNGAFNRSAEELQSLYEQTRGHHGLKVFEVGSTIDVARTLLSLDNRYGKEHKIDFALLGGHGDKFSVMLGQGPRSSYVSLWNFESPGHKRAKEFFSDDPTIILQSCSTGVDDGVAQKLSAILDARTVGPDKPTRLSSMSVTYEQGKPKFTISYSGANANVYEHGEKLNTEISPAKYQQP